MDNQEIGRVTHYYDKAMVALVKLSGKIRIGDTVMFAKGEDSFEMDVDSMQVNHEAINEAGSGEEVAIKVVKATKEGAVVSKAEN